MNVNYIDILHIKNCSVNQNHVNRIELESSLKCYPGWFSRRLSCANQGFKKKMKYNHSNVVNYCDVWLKKWIKDEIKYQKMSDNIRLNWGAEIRSDIQDKGMILRYV